MTAFIRLRPTELEPDGWLLPVDRIVRVASVVGLDGPDSAGSFIGFDDVGAVREVGVPETVAEIAALIVFAGGTIGYASDADSTTPLA